jgi:MYXO-CTERM domain-containing protein
LCASGFCVEGVCCDVAACSGACKSCNVPGSEGTCVPAAAGTEVPGSCAEGKSCDASGACKTKNGQACTTPADCASGFCVDGVCCDSACTGECMSCNQTGRAGTCTGYAAGTDPESECGKGTGVCRSTCDGIGSCAFPQWSMSCGECLRCDGAGDCSVYDYLTCPWGTGGYAGGFGGRPYPTGGSGGYIPNVGGSGGYAGGFGGRPYPTGGRGGYPPNVGGSGGYVSSLGGWGGGVPALGGVAGSLTVLGGAGGLPVVGGSAGNVPRRDGAAGSVLGYGGNLPGLGGGPGSRDGAAGDAGTLNLHKSGCSCEVGGGGLAGPGLALPFLLAGAAWSFLHKRRRR